MKITIRSKILIALGSYIYGTPESFGVKCTPEEFYALQSDRPIHNQTHHHPARASKWKTMVRNWEVEQARQKVFKHMCIASLIASIGIFTAGTLLTSGIVKTKEVASSITSKYESNKANKASVEARIKQIEKEAEQLTTSAGAGLVTEEQYKTRSEALQKEYSQLKEQL